MIVERYSTNVFRSNRESWLGMEKLWAFCMCSMLRLKVEKLRLQKRQEDEPNISIWEAISSNSSDTGSSSLASSFATARAWFSDFRWF